MTQGKTVIVDGVVHSYPSSNLDRGLFYALFVITSTYYYIVIKYIGKVKRRENEWTQFNLRPKFELYFS